MRAKKPSPAETEKKAPKKPKGSAAPKKPGKGSNSGEKPSAAQWRAVPPQKPEDPEEPIAAEASNPKPPPRTPGTAVMVIPREEPEAPKSPWEQFKAELPESIDEFMAFIAKGGHMAGWCGDRGINYTTMLKFVHADPSRSEMYARAREDRADVLVDEIVAISDEETIELKQTDAGTIALFDKTAVARNRLRVDARKWVAAKLRPRVYGDKLEVEGTVNHKTLTDAELLGRLAALGAAIPSIVPEPVDEGESDA